MDIVHYLMIEVLAQIASHTVDRMAFYGIFWTLGIPFVTESITLSERDAQTVQLYPGCGIWSSDPIISSPSWISAAAEIWAGATSHNFCESVRSNHNLLEFLHSDIDTVYCVTGYTIFENILKKNYFI